MAAVLVFQNNAMTAILVYYTNPVEVELFSYVKSFLLFQQNCMAAGRVSENALNLPFINFHPHISVPNSA